MVSLRRTCPKVEEASAMGRAGSISGLGLAAAFRALSWKIGLNENLSVPVYKATLST